MENTDPHLPLVLVIDDDRSVHLWAERFLIPAGFLVVEALSGKAGIAVFRQEHPDIVLVDIRMPGMGGFETCEKLRELPRGKESAILMMTGAEDPETIEHSFHSGATDFVVKPVNWEILIHRLRYMVKANSEHQQLQRSEKRYQDLIDNTPFSVYEINESGKIQSMNKTGLTSLKKVESEVINKPYLDFITPGRRDDLEQFFTSTLNGEDFPGFEHTRIENGEILWFQTAYTLISDHRNNKTILGVSQNITKRKRAEIALLENTQMLEAILNNTSAVVYLKDLDGKYIFINHQFEVLFHINNEQLKGKTDIAVHPEHIAKQLRENDLITIEQDKNIEFEEVLKQDDGLHTYISVKFPIYDHKGNIYATCSISTDISERKQAEQEIRNLAFYDPLTELPNRRLLLDRIKQELIVAKRDNQYGAIIFLDLDYFKALNDSKGHQVGDELLIQVASRLTSVLREGDTASRLGGDEFVILLASEKKGAVEIADKAYLVAEKIKNAINKPYLLAGNEHYFSTSIGISIFPENSNSPDDILQQADTAMYLSKDSGRNTIHFFKPHMQEAADRRIQLENELRVAIEQQQFVLYYQPQVNQFGEMVSTEALIRWKHPEKGLIPPNDFIPIAEEINLIVPIGMWILDEVCRQIKSWRASGLDVKRVAINVSANQFKQECFVDTFHKAIQKNNISASQLAIELTEGVVIKNIDDTIKKMEALKALGIMISIDDFGTGYSSLSYLKTLPIDQLKIDHSFINDIANNKDDAVITETIISMCKHLGLEVIAEGVETKEQFELLKEKGCDLFQGRYFGRPLPANDFNKQ